MLKIRSLSNVSCYIFFYLNSVFPLGLQMCIIFDFPPDFSLFATLLKNKCIDLFVFTSTTDKRLSFLFHAFNICTQEKMLKFKGTKQRSWPISFFLRCHSFHWSSFVEMLFNSSYSYFFIYEQSTFVRSNIYRYYKIQLRKSQIQIINLLHKSLFACVSINRRKKKTFKCHSLFLIASEKKYWNKC